MSKPELAMWATEGTGRAYKHPFRQTPDGKPLTSPSITTVLKYENKENLIQWAADKSIEWAVNNWHLLGSRSNEDAMKAGRYRWRGVRDERAEVGTGIHETVEAEHKGTWDFPDLDEEQKQIMEQWRKFNQRYTIKPLLTEFTVWNFSEDYAGTGDGLWEITENETGKSWVALIDLKTSKGVYGGQWAQIAALKNGEVLMHKAIPDAVPNRKGEWPEGTWEERPMPDADSFAVVHLRADKAELIFGEDLDLRFEQFKAYRTIWGVENELKEREKKREVASYGDFA